MFVVVLEKKETLGQASQLSDLEPIVAEKRRVLVLSSPQKEEKPAVCDPVTSETEPTGKQQDFFREITGWEGGRKKNSLEIEITISQNSLYRVETLIKERNTLKVCFLYRQQQTTKCRLILFRITILYSSYSPNLRLTF